MRKILVICTLFVMLAPLAGSGQISTREHTIDSLKKEVNAHQALPALRAYINILGYTNDTVKLQFDEWMKQYPKSATIPFALGEAYYAARDRKGFQYLSKAWDEGDTSKRLQQMFNVMAGDLWQLDIPRTDNTIDSLITLIVNNPDSLLPLQQYLFLLGSDNDTAVNQVADWIKSFPDAVNFPYVLAESYYNAESPKARPYLLKVVELQPRNAKAYLMLSIDAERWGRNDEARDYMGKAAEADTTDASYAFYYADMFEAVDTAVWHKKIWQLTKRFPNNERGAQGLYWLANRSHNFKDKIAVGEQLRKLYPPDKFNWSESGMDDLFYNYLQNGQVDKAVALARELNSLEGFDKLLALAKNIQEVNTLVDAKKYNEAIQKMAQVKAPRYSSIGDMVALLKARIWYAAGQPQKAYDSLLAIQANSPADNIKQAIAEYGVKLGKTDAQQENDVWAVRNKHTKPAPGFALGTYTPAAKGKLDDYRGKVVLLTFWFPGCGPCRGEMPHFENVLRKYNNGNVAYIGINVTPDQDEYVLPFMRGTKYSFTPLRATDDWAKKTYGVRGEPTNFLIDQNGNIVFDDFRIDGNNEHQLELMINSLLVKKG